MSPSFIHLHLHSEYSLTDSTIRIGDLVKRCAAMGMPAVALTDQSNLFATVKFVKDARKAGLKPIVGADLWLTSPEQATCRITVLCQSYAGYLSLSRLLSKAWLQGHADGRVQIDPDWLAQHAEDLILILGRESAVAQCMAEGREELARRQLRHWSRIFPDRLYLELTRCGRAGEEVWVQQALHLGFEFDLPAIASNDVRFVERDDFEAHEARVCISTGRVLADPKRPREYSAEQYLKSPEQMTELFADLPEALQNSVELAKRCNIELQLGTYYLPEFPIPDGHTLESWIRHTSHEGLSERLAKQPCAAGHDEASYRQRLDIELDVIIKMGFPGYFLIVADFINWAKQNDIPVGPGRGSGAGSLVAWALGITDLDPLPYDLLFERFLNPERVSMPDFDIDFCMDRRDEVIDYVARKYGRDHVSQIITYGTMAAKAVIRDTGRVLGYPYGFVDGIAKLIPMTLGICLDDALGRSEKAAKDRELCSAELIQRYQDEDDVRELVDLALKLEDLTRNAGKHAGGVVIGPKPLTEFCPLFAEEGGKNPVTQFDKDDVEAVGLVKFDFLGLRTLTIIDWAVKAINKRRDSGFGIRDSQKRDSAISKGSQQDSVSGPAQTALTNPESRIPNPGFLDITALPLDDAATYRLFARGDTVAVFQFESRGMRELLKRAKPDRFEDIIALAALFRPGPLGSGMDKDWVDRKHGNAEVTYPHPLLEPVLSPTYGVIVYQEQVMQIAQVLAGYSLGGADLLRRAMGKKKPEEMAKERAKFEAGCAERGIAAEIATPIFDLMEKFAEYGFNKSHSAAYALVAYQTAWLKQHYPAEFMAAVCSSDMDNTDKVVNFLTEVKALKIEVLPPDVNASAYMFEAVGDKVIRYGLGAIKGVGRGAVEAIVEERQRGGAYRDLLDFCQRVEASKLNRRVIEAMISAGALDALGPNRASLFLQLPEVLRATEQAARDKAAGQIDIFGGSAAQPIQIELPTCNESALETRLEGERETLGHYLSGHPLDPYRELLSQVAGYRLDQLEKAYADKKGQRFEAGYILLAGLVTAVRMRGDTQAFVQLEDGLGRVEAAFFREPCMNYRGLLSRDRILILEGNLQEDEFNGGWSLRVKHAWDFKAEITRLARRLDLQLDLRKPAAFERLNDLLKQYRPGNTPLRLDISTPTARGTLDANGKFGVRAEPELLQKLAEVEGIVVERLHLNRPQANQESHAA
ncbi:DNA polymerase III subunit alpha [Pseudomarimonas arenosa]|uniref:DNA polymerase III subunit alpha n=1 Tax=Pseudomarimonas arenosa TaxID=2774145 RepID=A0AAW3ZNX7_9GAMM|nr:DNA polymerase III subunit alpha [Pseudomarimonas arenosa]MBD8527210.1 DNA polymerase III subunit alpha [Pseudomarimonas arenosa]